MPVTRHALGLILATTLATAAQAQPAVPPPQASSATSNATPDPATLALARQLVSKVQPDPHQLIAKLAAPLTGLVEHMGVPDLDHARTLVQQVILPVLQDNIAGMTDMYAHAYALVLTPADLRGVLAFYDTPAGQHLIAAQPAIAGMQLTIIQSWIGSLRAQMQTRIDAAIKQHGWTKS